MPWGAPEVRRGRGGGEGEGWRRNMKDWRNLSNVPRLLLAGSGERDERDASLPGAYIPAVDAAPANSAAETGESMQPPSVDRQPTLCGSQRCFGGGNMERLRRRRRRRRGGSEPSERRKSRLRKQDVTRGNGGLEDIRKHTISR